MDQNLHNLARLAPKQGAQFRSEERAVQRLARNRLCQIDATRKSTVPAEF